MKSLVHKYAIFYKVLPMVAIVLGLKAVCHAMGWEILTLGPLVTAIITANVFLIGFLLSGTISDFKESEKLPGDLASSLEAMHDEASILWRTKQAPVAREAMEYVAALNTSLIKWFHKEERSVSIMNKITGLNTYFAAFEPLTQANFITRMKQEQNTVRKIVVRIHTIRETSFVKAGYAIAEIVTFLLIVSFLLLAIKPLYESLLFVGVLSLLLMYMLLLIEDMDNPFDHYERSIPVSQVSIKPLEDLALRLGKK